MKRILFGTSALGLTLSVLAMAPVMAQTTCDTGVSGAVNLSSFVCDFTDDNQMLDLSSLTGPGLVTIQGTVEGLSVLDQPNAAAGTDASTVEISISAQSSSTIKPGELKFANIEFGENGDVLSIEGSSSFQDGGETKLGQAGTINDSNIDFGAGNDVMNVAGTITNNGSVANAANQVNMGEGDDIFNIASGGIATFSNTVLAGDGNDSFYNDGSLSGVVDMGADEDYFQNSQTFTGRIDMGSGNDEFHAIDYVPSMQSATTTTIDGGAHDMVEDPNDPNLMVPTAGDVLRLDGTNGSSSIKAERIANFETLIKQGAGTWSMDSAFADGSMVEFVNGVSINEGAMNFDGMTLLSTVTNNGTLGGDFKIESLQNNEAGSDASLRNTNLGIISGSIEFSDFDDTFVNEGLIRAHYPGENNNTPVVFDMGAGSDTFENSGNVSGLVNLGDDDDRFVLEGSNLFSISPAGTILGGQHSVGGGDTIELSGNGGNLMQINDVSSQIREFENIDITSGTWALSASQSGLNTVSVSGGTFNSSTQVSALDLIVDGGDMNITSFFTAGNTNVTNGTLSILNSLLSSPTTIGNGGHLHSNGVISGDLTVEQGGTISAVDHDEIGDFDVSGNMVLDDGSKVIVNVDPVTGLADLIDIEGFLTIADGATIEVIPTSALEQGQYFEVDVADASIVNGVFNIAPNSEFTDYQIQYSDDGVVSLLMGASFAPVSITGGANANPEIDINGNQILAHIIASNNANNASSDPDSDTVLSPDLINLLGAMGPGAAAADAQAAADAVSPEFYNAGYLSARSYSNHVGSKVLDRIDDKEWCATMQGAGEANCRANRGDNGDLWGSLEVFATNNKKSNVSSHKGTTFAGLIGMDRRMGLMTGGLVGGFGVSNSDVNSKGSSKGFNASLGGYLSIPAQILNIDSSMVYNYGSAESTRSFDDGVVGGVAGDTSTFTGKSVTHQFSGNVRLTQEYKNEFGLEIQPSVGLGMNFMKMPGFTEASPVLSALALILEDSSHFDADAKLGVQVRMPFRSAGGTMIPEARVNIAKKIAGQKMSTQARFAGTAAQDNQVADFQIEGELPDFTYNVGVGVNYELDSGLMIMGDYDFNGGSDTTEHKGSLGLRYDF